MPQRTALLIRCSPEDAAHIRDGAARERRTVSGYVLNILDLALKIEDSLWDKLARFNQFNRVLSRVPTRTPGYKTTVLIRCEKDEARRIRLAARRRETTISDFVINSLQRFWTIAANRRAP